MQGDNLKPPNPARITSNVWWGITAASIFVIFLPGIIGVDGFNGGFAVSFLGFFLVIMGVIIAVIYMRRASTLDNIFEGKNVLAHWTYPRDEWIEYAEKEYKRDRAGKKQLFIVIAVIALVIGIIFFLADHKGGLWVLAMMVALIAILAFTAWFTAWYNHRENIKYLGEAYITPDAVYLNRQLHIWDGLGSWLASVKIKDDTSPYLEFKYMALTRTVVQEYDANVPIPKGKEQEAEGLLGKFKLGISSKKIAGIIQKK
jgi:hypothetical protein